MEIKRSAFNKHMYLIAAFSMLLDLFKTNSLTHFSRFAILSDLFQSMASKDGMHYP